MVDCSGEIYSKVTQKYIYNRLIWHHDSNEELTKQLMWAVLIQTGASLFKLKFRVFLSFRLINDLF